MPHDVFISHAAQDKQVAEAICTALEDQRVECWMAPRDIVPGIHYAEAIVNAISTSRLFVVVLSANAIASNQVSREVERAGAKGIPIVTFKLDALPMTPSLEYFLSQSHWLEALTTPLDSHLRRLTEAVSMLLGSTASPSDEYRHTTVARRAPGSDPQNLLHALWDLLDPNLQDAFSLAYNKKCREGSTRISTRDFFQALVRIQDHDLQPLLESLPGGALPEPVEPAVQASPQLLEEEPLLSDCVADSLSNFRKLEPLPRRLSSADVFVDIAKHGHGPSVARLREHGIGDAEIEAQVKKLGLSVLRRTS